MTTIHWQKSTYSGDSSNCVYVAATPTGAIHLRESDEPDVVLSTSSARLHELIRILKAHPPIHSA
ncbi:DUF397 domain-containing protein [Streptomyces sp. ActVer]|uniref:DUF397 domain-containing protein n=1 Tax=Streptomyces sp. ActVer TaxID=3014558 RepID=UPI0022B307DF|nr:DUF397 domain-containing protein [Streptomyces sp. ActVer]MCZ4515768.1 DUF397 domain-containing protein [Streptomyces sp. ActVer]